MKTLALGVLLVLSPVLASAQISVTIQRPSPNSLVGDNFAVAATGQTVSMSHSSCAYITFSRTCNPGWSGRIPTSGLWRGDVDITVTARDVFSNVAVNYRRTTFDRPPVLILEQPSEYAIAIPFVHVRGTCQDDDPAGCATVLVTNCPSGTYETRTIAGSVIDVFVRPCGGGFGTITLVATDFAGQQTLRSIEGITTETSPTLRAVATVGGRILDARDERILYTRNYLGSNPEMWIYNFVRGTEERVCLSSEARKNPTIGSIQEALTRCLSQHKARSQTRPSASRPASPNQVRQLGHVSTDGGKTWTVSFDLTYVRKPPKA